MCTYYDVVCYIYIVWCEGIAYKLNKKCIMRVNKNEAKCLNCELENGCVLLTH